MADRSPQPSRRVRRVRPRWVLPAAAGLALLIGLVAAYLATRDGSGRSAAFVSPSAAPAPTPSTATSSPVSTATSPSASSPAPRSSSPGTPRTARPAPAAGGSLAGLAGKVIVIDPGHNGDNYAHPEVINQLVNVVNGTKACDTTGTETDAGYAEHAFTWELANRLAAMLRGAGARVILTRSNDAGVGPCITERAAIGNRAHADLAISLHADGGPATGFGFHVIEPGPVGPNDAIVAPSARLGLAIRAAFRAGTGEPYATYIAHNGIDVRTDLGGLNLSVVPKVFIECGNMRNATDAARLVSAAWRQQAAQAIAAGMAAYLRAG